MRVVYNVVLLLEMIELSFGVLQLLYLSYFGAHWRTLLMRAYLLLILLA